ncbi:MAG: hypothetical protein WCC60_05210 [Ilumatobacteraceae bacterium]
MSRVRRTLFAAVTLASAVGLAATDVADAKSISRLPASCSAGTSAYMIYLSSGSKVTLGFGSDDPASLGQWHIVVSDNGTPALDHTLTATVSSWTVSTQRTLTKGSHLLALSAENLDNGEICTYSIANKV